jgi:hypothetical protein
MEASGGMIFKERDLELAKRVLALMSKASYQLGAQEMIHGSEALGWLVNTLIPGIEANILEVKKVAAIQAAPEGSSTEA